MPRSGRPPRPCRGARPPGGGATSRTERLCDGGFVRSSSRSRSPSTLMVVAFILNLYQNECAKQAVIVRSERGMLRRPAGHPIDLARQELVLDVARRFEGEIVRIGVTMKPCGRRHALDASVSRGSVATRRAGSC